MHANIHKLRTPTSFCNCEKMIFFTKNIPAKKRAKEFGQGQENMNFIQEMKCVIVF